MSLRDVPLTKNCDVIDVMGNRIATSVRPKKRQEPADEVTHWQPFQIKGGRVIPCRITTPFDESVVDSITGDPEPRYYMPTIGGIPMDQGGAPLSGVGDVYLNVEFKIDDEADRSVQFPHFDFVIESCNISRSRATAEEGDAIVYEQRISYDGTEYTYDLLEITSPWQSWRIGSINDSRKLQSMRYFSGYNDASWNAIDFSVPIYRKGTFYSDPKEWGIASISIGTAQELTTTASLDPVVEELLTLRLAQKNQGYLVGKNAGDVGVGIGALACRRIVE